MWHVDLSVRDVLGRLDRSLERFSAAGAGVWFLAAPATVFLLWQVWPWWAALLGGAGSTFCLK